MTEFWQVLRDPDIEFLRLALIMGALASVAFGMTGSLVVVKRISYLAGAISHAVLGGIGAAIYFQRVHGIEWLHPLLGAWFAAIAAALVISWVRWAGLEREDSVIGAVWATGMAIGLVFLSQTPGFVDPMSYLFGNILILSRWELSLVLLLDALLLLVVVFGYTRLQAIAFDEELARLRGINVPLFHTLLLCLIATTVVLLVAVVGVVLVVALLTIPAAISSRFFNSLAAVMAAAILITFAFISSGIALSFLSDWPTGPSIILIAAACYLLQRTAFRN